MFASGGGEKTFFEVTTSGLSLCSFTNAKAAAPTIPTVKAAVAAVGIAPQDTPLSRSDPAATLVCAVIHALTGTNFFEEVMKMSSLYSLHQPAAGYHPLCRKTHAVVPAHDFTLVSSSARHSGQVKATAHQQAFSDLAPNPILAPQQSKTTSRPG